MLLHYTKQLGKFGFLHTCSPVTELLAKTPFYISSPGQLSNPPVTPPKILCEKGGVRCYSEIFDRRPVSLYIFGPDNCQPLN